MAREYRAQALSVRRFTEAYATTTFAYGYHRRWWGGYGRWGVFAVPVIVRTDAWGVFQGERRIDVPTTLGVLGDTEGKVALERRIATNRTLGTTGYVVGFTGLGAAVVGFVARDNVPTVEGYVAWSNVAARGRPQRRPRARPRVVPPRGRPRGGGPATTGRRPPGTLAHRRVPSDPAGCERGIARPRGTPSPFGP
jgi:hypothetical protein